MFVEANWKKKHFIHVKATVSIPETVPKSTITKAALE